jgi:hypothetical protein
VQNVSGPPAVIVGTAGSALTVRVYVTTEGAQGAPEGLSDVSVIVTVLPASPGAGVYVKAKGEDDAVAGVTDPAPFSVIVTVVALINVFPLTVTGVVPHVLPLRLAGVIAGALTQPQDTLNEGPDVVQPPAFLTVIEWLPLATPVKVTPAWYAPPSRLYSRPAPVGLVTVTDAFPAPREQSVV